MAKTPTPTDEVSSAAGRILGSGNPFDSRKRVRQFSQLLADKGIGRIVRDGDGNIDLAITEALDAAFGDFVKDAHSLAGFVANADPVAGKNRK